MTKMNSNSDLQVALNDFSLNFLKSYHQTDDKNNNLFYSPISLSSTLSLLLSGADGITKRQLVDLLVYHDLGDTLEVAFKKLKDDLKPNVSDNRLLFKMANRVYVETNTRLQDDFRLIAKETYDTDLLKADFQRDSEQLVDDLNRWIELETRNKIQNAFQQIDRKTMMLLINVVYFKGEWENPFNDVYPQEFTNLNGEKKQVETMSRQGGYRYGQFEQYGILQLDYLGNASMYIVLPNEDVNLHHLLLELNSRKLNEDLSKLKSTEVSLLLPKFKLETSINLKNLLEQLGVDTLFNKNANLSKILEEPGSMVSKAMQKAVIEVDENGTEATAMTEMHCELGFGDPLPAIKFHVNRPFIFLIRLNGVNIFVGALKQF